MRYLKKRVVLCIWFYLLISLCGCGIEETPSAVIKEKNENHSFEETENVSEQEVSLALTGEMNISQEITGAFFYTEPVKTDEDYQLYFKKKNDAESWDDQYTTADMTYKFPDVREKNQPIGKPLEVYFVESMEFSGDEFSDFLFVAAYEVNGKYCFDTRVYTGCDTGYEVDRKMSEYLNEKYPNLENGDYPLANSIGDDPLENGVIDELREIYNKMNSDQAFASVLRNESAFYCTNAIPYQNRVIIHEANGYLNEITYGDGKKLNPPRFAVIDLDGNSIPEVVLEIENSYGFLILRYTEGKVRGNIVGYRSFCELKKNGMFHASSGCDNSSWGKLFFIKDTFVMDESITIYGQSYYKKDIPITEETWKKLNAEVNEMENVRWYDYSPESIDTYIIKNPLFSEKSVETQQLMDKRQAYINSLSYLIDMTYDYTKKSSNELNADAKKYYNACREELDKIYELCIKKLSKEEAEKLKEEQIDWEEIINRRLTDDLKSYPADNIEKLEDQSIYYTYGDILLKRIFHLINVYFEVHFYD